MTTAPKTWSEPIKGRNGFLFEFHCDDERLAMRRYRPGERNLVRPMQFGFFGLKADVTEYDLRRWLLPFAGVNERVIKNAVKALQAL